MPNIEVTFVALITGMGARYLVIAKEKVKELIELININMVVTKELSWDEMMAVKGMSETLLKQGIDTVSSGEEWYFELISIDYSSSLLQKQN